MGIISTIQVHSTFLFRTVTVDVYGNMASTPSSSARLLIMNDGQDLPKMNFEKILDDHHPAPFPFICVGVHAGVDRKQEYGISGFPDYLQRGSKASAYAAFLLEELLPVIQQKMGINHFNKLYLSGFSLGGLMAFDMAIDYPDIFSGVGVFSGSFWWRSKALDDGYLEEHHRIMHAKIKRIGFHEGRRFFLQVGALDEMEDRNNNGIIDAIDDTMDIIKELKTIGYESGKHIRYLEMPNGSHNVETWGRAMPDFLQWLAGLA